MYGLDLARVPSGTRKMAKVTWLPSPTGLTPISLSRTGADVHSTAQIPPWESNITISRSENYPHWKIIPVFTRVRHWIVSKARRIQSTLLHPVYLSVTLILYSHNGWVNIMFCRHLTQDTNFLPPVPFVPGIRRPPGIANNLPQIHFHIFFSESIYIKQWPNIIHAIYL